MHLNFASFLVSGIGVIAVLAVIVGSILWLWSLIHCISNNRLSDTNRVIGIVLIVTLGFLGSILYLFLPRQAHYR